MEIFEFPSGKSMHGAKTNLSTIELLPLISIGFNTGPLILPMLDSYGSSLSSVEAWSWILGQVRRFQSYLKLSMKIKSNHFFDTVFWHNSAAFVLILVLKLLLFVNKAVILLNGLFILFAEHTYLTISLSSRTLVHALACFGCYLLQWKVNSKNYPQFASVAWMFVYMCNVILTKSEKGSGLFFYKNINISKISYWCIYFTLKW